MEQKQMIKSEIKLKLAEEVNLDLYTCDGKKFYINCEELHSWLGVKTQYSKWITRKIEQFGFEENEDYTLVKIGLAVNGHNGGGKVTKFIYWITPDMTKQLAMVEDKEKGKLVRKYYLELEKYVQESGQLQEFIYFRKTGKVARRGLTDELSELRKEVDEPKYIYPEFTNLIYIRLFGATAKELRNKKGLSDKGNDTRDICFTPQELLQIKFMEDKVKSIIEVHRLMGTNPNEIYETTKNLIENVKIPEHLQQNKNNLFD